MLVANGGSTLVGLAIALFVYFLPAIIGRIRGVPNLGSIFVINLFLGWTLIGWVIALAMAARSREVKPTSKVDRMHRECPFCKEPMRRDASVCPHCRNQSDPMPLNDGSKKAASGAARDWWR